MSAPKRRRDVEWDDYYNVPREPLIPVKFNIPRRQSSSSSASSASVPKNKNPLIDFITRPAPPPRRPSTPSPSPPADATKPRRILADHLCISCAQPGHQADFCPSLVCPHCGARNPRHDASACPAWRKCRRCRQRGHDEPACTGARARPGLTAGDECDVCGELGHVEEECGGLWCTVPPKVARERIEDGEKRVVDAGIRSCVFCASDQHWGDECAERDRAGRDVPGTWKRREMVKKEEVQEEEELPPVRNWQRAMFDDFADL